MINFLGKSLVVLVAILSVTFLGVAIAVFTTHKNWKATIEQQDSRIAELESLREDFITQYKLTNANLRVEIASAENQLVKLERERVNWELRNEQVREGLEELKLARRDLTTNIRQTQDTNSELAQQNAQFRQDIENTQETIQVAFDEAVRATSELHDAKLKLETELERNAQLVEQIGGNE